MSVENILVIMVLVLAFMCQAELFAMVIIKKRYDKLIENIMNNYNHCYQSYHKMTLVSLMMMMKSTTDEHVFENTKEALIQLGANADRLSDEYSINQYINELVSEKEIKIENIEVNKK